jgi:hypothetical protein
MKTKVTEIPMPVYDENLFPKYEQSAKALGEMSMALQYLEQRLVVALAMLVSKEDITIGHIIASKLSFKNICETLRALTIHHFKIEQAVTWITQITRDCQKVEERRNTFIHSYYQRSFFEDRIVSRSKHKIGKKGYFLDLEYHEPKDLETLTLDIQKIMLRVDDFIDAAFTWRRGKPMRLYPKQK